MSSRVSVTRPVVTPPWVLVLLFLVLVAASARLLVGSYRYGNLLGTNSPLFYQAATLGFNYFELGAIRRGLGGTIVYLLSSNALIGTVYFHLLSAAAVAAGACLIFARMVASLPTRAAFALVLIAIMLRWGEDAGRTDMAVAAFLALAAWAMAQGRLVLACAAVGVGLFIHESSVIFGVPLLTSIALRQGLKSFPRRVWWRGAGVLALALGAYVVIWVLQPSIGTIVDVVRSKFERNDVVDWAIYFAVSGARGVGASICQNLTDPSYWVHPVGGLIVIAVAAVALSDDLASAGPALAVATLPPFLFLTFIANDTSRWTNFACFNVWLLLASTYRSPARARAPRWLAAVAALALLPLSHPKPDKIDYPIYAGSPLFERIVRKFGGPRTPSVEEALARCDPSWRDALDKAPRP